MIDHVDIVDVLAQAERLCASFSNNYYLIYVYKLETKFTHKTSLRLSVPLFWARKSYIIS